MSSESSDADNEDLMPPFVRLRWDAQEMGDPSSSFARSFVPVIGGNSMILRRVQAKASLLPPTVHGERISSGAKASIDSKAPLPEECSSFGSVYLQRFCTTSNMIVLDCTTSPLEKSTSSSQNDGSTAKKNSMNELDKDPLSDKAIYIWDKEANQEVAQDFLKMALSGLDIDDAHSEKKVETSYDRNSLIQKRPRTWEDAPELILRPRHVMEKLASSTSKEEAVTSSLYHPNSLNAWEAASSAVVGDIIEELQRVYDAEQVEAEGGEEAVHKAYLQEIYCYPDHRKDDEYDSNAEDFEGNDYPDDSSTVDNSEEWGRFSECGEEYGPINPTSELDYLPGYEDYE